MFCPGTDPGYGIGVCSGAQTNFSDAYNDAITYAGLGSTSSGWTGTIYFETGTHSGSFSVDGSDFSATTGGIPSVFTIMSVGNSSNTVLSDTVTINSMNAVTLQGFSVSAADPVAGIIVGNGTPITGTLTLTDVVVTNTAGDGIAIVQNNGDVIFNEVQASSNFGTGAAITNTTGSGNITVGQSTFNANGGDGLRINNSTSPATTTVTVSNSTFGDTTGNIFGVGLKIESNGVITLTSLTANSNLTGVYVDNTFGAGNVTVNGTNFFNYNDSGSTGLHVVSNGAISVSGVMANSNPNSNGAYLQTTGNDITVDSSTFDSNAIKGLYARTLGSGNVTLTNVTATGNGLGPYANGNGVEVEANGAVSVTGVTANSNGAKGAVIDNSGVTETVTVSNSTFGNTTGTGNVEKGLDIASSGDVLLTGVTASYNTLQGVYIANNAGAGNVTINGTNTFGNNGGKGVEVLSNGTIDASGITANNNGANGAYIDNSTGFATVTISNSKFGDALATGNTIKGLEIISNGDVTLVNVTASYNGSDGANITSNGATVFIDPSFFEGNGGNDLSVDSGAGNITLDCVTSTNNVFTTSGTVTITCSTSSQSTVIIIVVDDTSSGGGGGGTIIVDTLTDFAAFKTPDGISFFSYGVGGVGNFLIFVPDAVWKNAKPGEVIVNCLDSRGYNLRFSRLTDDRIALFGLGNTAPNEGWYLLRWFAPDGRLVNRVYVRLTFG
ncbi:MAG: hypothetical protein HZB17_04895 [Chloroflexi bacterium]|nr:hypothetical protein [Chloroflexota bacterium]